jgi:predicted nucleic acid-binding protein
VIVVSDASPIIALAAIGQVDLLRGVHGDVLVPAAVRDEIHGDATGVALLAASPWIAVRSATRRDLVRDLEHRVDAGEAEAIALAIELDADFLVIDDRRGRIVARSLGLRLTGVVGILLEAKARGLVPEIRALLDDLARGAAFRVSGELRRHALDLAGERD